MMKAREARETLNKGAVGQFFESKGDDAVKNSLAKGFNYATIYLHDCPSRMSKKDIAIEAETYYKELGYKVSSYSDNSAVQIHW